MILPNCNLWRFFENKILRLRSIDTILEEESITKCPCKCHYGGAVSCPGCKDNHEDIIKCEHCKKD